MITYRPDIDGLRALAVSLVILFHADLLGLSGGYTGVDVFFVISGYLITSILLKDIKTKNFSITKFYERRIKRIFPALFVVFLISTIAAYILMMPQELSGFGRSLTAATFFGSNILFWRESGYFDVASTLKPLLHTWSLSLEEQFYIFFPLYLYWAIKLFKKHALSLTIVGMLFSFALGLWTLSINKPIPTFYLLPTRAWELIAGAILAFGMFPAIPNKWINNILALIGFAMICIGGLMLSTETPFPGTQALIPVIGTMLIIYTGLENKQKTSTLIYKILSLKPLTFIGKISYSLYLWHWPLFVFSSYYLIRDLHSIEKVILIILSLGLSCLSWKYIEQPARKYTSTNARKNIFLWAGISMLIAGTIGGIFILSNGLPNRLTQKIQNLAIVTKGVETPSYNLSDFNWVNQSLGAKIDNPEVKPSFIVWGDSHANAIAPGFDQLGIEINQKGLLLKQAGCMPALNITDQDLSKECQQFNQDVVRIIDNGQFQQIFIIGRWLAYPRWMSGTSQAKGTEQSRQRLAELLTNTIQYLQHKNINVTLLAQVPPITAHTMPASALGRSAYYHGEPMDLRSRTDEYLKSQDHILSIFKTLESKTGVTIIYPHQFLCDETYCMITHNGKSLYYDDDHLSGYGAKYFSRYIRNSFQSTNR